MILKNLNVDIKNNENISKNEKKIKNRIYELDFLKGIAVIGVMIDHLLLFIYFYRLPRWILFNFKIILFSKIILEKSFYRMLCLDF